MKIKDLITYLSGFNPDLPVLLLDPSLDNEGKLDLSSSKFEGISVVLSSCPDSDGCVLLVTNEKYSDELYKNWPAGEKKFPII
jgi:hypothetical protein